MASLAVRNDLALHWRGRPYPLAAALLACDMPRRWQHSLRVASQARDLRVLVGEDARQLEHAAVLHDVGYASALLDTGFHAIDGARFLRQAGFDERIVRMVAHHSCASVEADLRGLATELRDFEHPGELLSDSLTFCDMTSGPDGELMNVNDRLAEILVRHAGNAVIERFVALAAPALIEACNRTVERRARAGPRRL